MAIGHKFDINQVMRFYFLLLSLAFSTNTFSCDPRMKDYVFECSYQDQFNKLKTDFNKYNANPLTLKGHLLPHVLGAKDYQSKRSEYLNNSKQSLEGNLQWITWTKTQEYVTKLNPLSLVISDIVKLHSKISTSKSMGKLRTSNAEINPSILYSCEEEKIDSGVVNLIRTYDLTTDEGYPLLSITNISDCVNSRETKSGKIVFYKSASVRSELNRWLVDFNDTLLRYEDKEFLDVSPYQYLADMRRWFMAISPFTEGNQQVAEALMLYGSRRLNLPPLALPKRGIPTLLSQDENRSQVIQQMKGALIFFEGCLYEIKTNLVSEECSPIQF